MFQSLLSLYSSVINSYLGLLGLGGSAAAALLASVFLVYDDNNTNNRESVTISIRDADSDALLATLESTTDDRGATLTIPTDTTITQNGESRGTRNVVISGTLRKANGDLIVLDDVYDGNGDQTVDFNLRSDRPTYIVVSRKDADEASIQVTRNINNAANDNGGDTPAYIAGQEFN